MVNWKEIFEVLADFDLPANTRKSWRQRGFVPHKYRLIIQERTLGRIRVFDERRVDQDARV